MDDGPEGRFISRIRNLFRKNGHALEEHILEAKDDGEIKGEDVSMLLNVLDLEDRLVSDIMVPRADIDCAEVSDGATRIAEMIISQGHSRIPVYEGDKDHIIGVVHAKDLLRSLLEPEEDRESVKDIMREPYFVSETTSLKALLKSLQADKVHLAVVRDEYGGTSGIVTLEDVLEEIVGEIEDEYDEPKPEEIQEQDDGSVLVSGRVPLDELASRLKLRLDSDKVETIGGYLCELAGRIPAQGEFFTLQGRRLTVAEADAKQIRKILIQPLPVPRPRP
ncbi:MAG: hemolysin family protein [Desulfovibrionaceae bacterium]|nr:hemolysin family protein [Desulfovibrionaceae bacterium]